MIAFWFCLAAQNFCDWLIDLAQFSHPPIRTQREKEKTSYPKPLFQSQAKCEATDMKISFYSLHTRKNWNSLIASFSFWKWEFLELRKWPDWTPLWRSFSHAWSTSFPGEDTMRTWSVIDKRILRQNQFGNVISVIIFFYWSTTVVNCIVLFVKLLTKLISKKSVW